MDSSSCDIYQLSSLLRSRSLRRSKSGGSNNTALPQLLGRTLDVRADCGADLAECVLATGDFLRPQGPIPLGYCLLRGVLPGAKGAYNKGNADGAVGILGKCRVRVGSGPALGPTKKGLVPHFLVRWGDEQIPQSRTQSRYCLNKSLPRTVILLNLGGVTVVYVLFAFNTFLITYFCVVSSFEPPLDHNTFLNGHPSKHKANSMLLNFDDQPESSKLSCNEEPNR